MWSEDECHFQRHGTRCRMWTPPEEADPVVLHAPTRESISCFGAVNLRTGMFVHTFSPIFNAATFEVFLRGLLRCRSQPKRMVVVLDNARYHHAKLLRPLLSAHRQHLELLFLPPYSPQTRSHRAGLEADAAISHAQPVLRQLGPTEGSGRPLF